MVTQDVGVFQPFTYFVINAVLSGWLYGVSNGVFGYFPAELVKPLARHEVDYTRREAIERSPSFRVSVHVLIIFM